MKLKHIYIESADGKLRRWVDKPTLKQPCEVCNKNADELVFVLAPINPAVNNSYLVCKKCLHKKRVSK